MNTIVTVKEGALEGAFSDDKQSVIFKGVPYAAPPVGELRWKRPQPHAKWEGVRPALEFSAKAPQTDLSKMDLYGKEFYSDENLKQSEDCLYLNIWTPASAQPGDKLPVFFWIHGGAFTHGSGAEKEFDGEQFAKNGVVFVSINYRVGALGFFVHPEPMPKIPRASAATTVFTIELQRSTGYTRILQRSVATRTASRQRASLQAA
ncbi:carboxylesterase family protein [Hominenteromicrobium sp.]|uniref:carboxylesterase family protein n=1 Tax=Hominenteromicrobium sp. TaxID=3073581 RepID=UPI0039949D89